MFSKWPRRSLIPLLFLMVWGAMPALADKWISGHSLTVRSKLHTTTLLPDGKVMVIGGTDGVKTSREILIYDHMTNRVEYSNTLALQVARKSHTATLLPSGKVLIVGGVDVASVEIFDPVTRTRSAAASLKKPRHSHTATLLPSGKVLVVGGLRYIGVAEASCEIYDPETNAWTQVQHPDLGRWGHTATLLPSGKVLVLGGKGPAFTADGAESPRTALLYDPNTGTWSQAAAPLMRRSDHTATLFASGEVLVAGGSDAQGALLASAQLYDPVSGTATDAGNMNKARSLHTAALLPSGDVLLVGGVDNSTEMYSPQAPLGNRWVATASIDSVLPTGNTATLLPNGKVLVVGNGQTRIYIYNHGDAWVQGSTMKTPRINHTATLLPTGRMLVAGGNRSSDNVPLASAELYDPAADVWTETSSLGTSRWGHSATLLPSGKVLVAGGCSGTCTRADEFLNDARLYNPTTGAWEAAGQLQVARAHHGSTLLPSGEVLVSGGIGPATLGSFEIYQPATNTWRLLPSSMIVPRSSHTATLLPNGEVLLASGRGTRTSESFDPLTEASRQFADLQEIRPQHAATLLSSGDVIVVGGEDHYSDFVEETSKSVWVGSTASLSTLRRGRIAVLLLPTGDIFVAGGDKTESLSDEAEIYFPQHRASIVTSAPPSRLASGATATLLPSGRVLLAGATTLLYDPAYLGRNTTRKRPVLREVPSRITVGAPFTIRGTGFRGDAETGGGGTSSSAADSPMVQLVSVEGDRIIPLAVPSLSQPDPEVLSLEATSASKAASARFFPGWYLLTVTASGLRSEARLVEVACGLSFATQPIDQDVSLGSPATLTASAPGATSYQWQTLNGSGWQNIAGATQATYTTSAMTDPKSEVRYRVAAGNGCTTRMSREAIVRVRDSESPKVQVLAPVGGEYWLLGGEGYVAWSMSDDNHICRVEVSLLHSENGGRDWPGSINLRTFGTGPGCAAPGETTQDLLYVIPPHPPSGTVGSLYKVQVRAIDQSGKETTAHSPKPFYIVSPNMDAVETLILTHLPRMQARMGLGNDQITGLSDRLEELASHPRVQGAIIRLENNPDLLRLYTDWDAAVSGSEAAERANNLLFAPGGLHDYLLREILPVYTGAEYLVLVGDDRIIPMARLGDGTTLLKESTYVPEVDPARSTTVGRALAENLFLSDDPLASRRTINPGHLRDDSIVLPDLAVGRLVETPEEINRTIATFISQDGLLDLTAAGEDNKVLVTGYDFLTDMAERVRQRWSSRFGPAVNGELVSADWGTSSVAERRSKLRSSLEGNGGGRYGISILNGHATHDQEGVPGESPFTIEGLAAGEIYGPDACSNRPDGLDLAGGVVLSVGCHSGLPVAGSCSTNRSLDLPQTFLARGALSYVANTGYGWGLERGIGYSERLMEIVNEDLVASKITTTGHAVRKAKRRYVLEELRIDEYDRKTVMQWTMFGLPMYAVRTSSVFSGATEVKGGIVVESVLSAPEVGLEEASLLPPYLMKQSVRALLKAPRVFIKRSSAGAEVLPQGAPGCPDPNGCYYTLNDTKGRMLGADNQPLEPYFVFTSGIPGTSLHGALWKGGIYQQEPGWVPVIGRLVSNRETPPSGPIPEIIAPPLPEPDGGHRSTSLGEEECRTIDLEPNKLTVAAGYVLTSPEAPDDLSIHRIQRQIDMELFYYSNTREREPNCDRLGPVIDEQPLNGRYHTYDAASRSVAWDVPASDDAGVWRVMVVYDAGPNAQGEGRWIPLELTEEASGIWQGTVQLPETVSSRLTYLIQAVDQQGNVSRKIYDGAVTE